MLAFKGAARRRTPDGIARAAQFAGCEEAALEAVIAVEAGKSGFDAEGRPKALFEPHVFYRLLAAHGKMTALRAAIAQGLAYKRWGEKPYPHDSYPRIEAACEIDEECALMATSWGLPQILGENFEAAGYASVQDMVAAFAISEDVQLLGLAKFIDHAHLSGALQKRDWAAFARGYNGPSWRKNDYANKLARAYAHAKDATRPAPAPFDAAEKNHSIEKAADRSAKAHSAAAATIAVVAPGAMIAAHNAHMFPWWAVIIGAPIAVIAGLVIWNVALGLRKQAGAAHAASIAPILPEPAPAGAAAP